VFDYVIVVVFYFQPVDGFTKIGKISPLFSYAFRMTVIPSVARNLLFLSGLRKICPLVVSLRSCTNRISRFHCLLTLAEAVRPHRGTRSRMEEQLKARRRGGGAGLRAASAFFRFSRLAC
jgi:hypothetical protein